MSLLDADLAKMDLGSEIVQKPGEMIWAGLQRIEMVFWGGKD